MAKFISLEEDDNCQQDCAQCVAQFVPAMLYGQKEVLQSRKVDDSLARLKLTKMIEPIKANHYYIEFYVARHGDALRAKWKKMSWKNREKILLDVDPRLYPHKWPEQRSCYGLDSRSGQVDRPAGVGEEPGTHKASPVPRRAALLPWLNVETLVEDPLRLLSLHHYRSIFRLAHWVSFDAKQLRSGFTSGALAGALNDSCVVMHGEEYGRLVPWDRQSCHKYLTIGFPLAAAVLEAQTVLYEFLGNVIKAMVDPLVTRQGNSEWLAQTAAGFKVSGQLECWSTFANQAFSPPPVFDPHKCLQQARAQLRACQDHLDLMQTDPAYFHNQFPSQLSNCEYTVRVFEECKHEIKPFSSVPVKYNRAMSSLQSLCLQDAADDRQEINGLMASCKGFARNFIYRPGQQGRAEYKLQFATQTGESVHGAMFRRDPLHWALMLLGNDPTAMFGQTAALTMAFIDNHLSRCDSKELERISPELYHHLALMSFYYSIVDSVDYHRPKPKSAGLHTYTDEENNSLAWRYHHRGPSNPTHQESTRVGHLLVAFFNQQLPKGPMDEKRLHATSNIHQHLVGIWDEVRAIQRRRFENATFAPDDISRPFTAKEIEDEISILSAGQSGVFKSELEAQRKSIIACIAERKARQDAVRSAPIQTTWGDTPGTKIELPIGRVKPKTRPQDQNHGSNNNNNTEELEPATETLSHEARTKSAKIQVNKNSLDIFHKMFPAQADESTKGVKWPVLVTAMADAGFAATHNGGSAVTFQPSDDEARGSIVVHRPHPDPTVNPVMLQTMGKRMRKWFGWERESFVEREKEV